MNVIISDTFKKDFQKLFKKGFDISVFAGHLKTQKFFNLEEPYVKFKCNMFGSSVRGIVVLNTSTAIGGYLEILSFRQVLFFTS